MRSFRTAGPPAPGIVLFAHGSGSSRLSPRNRYVAEQIVGGEIGALPKVTAPTLLIVGSLDPVVIGLNSRALAQLNCEARLEIVPGATHLFEEPGTLPQVAGLATEWFRRWL